ncbi:sulfatase [Amycolatopsis sp. NPDC059021]|uniref:sulfatase n=1 Tax=Amycolatopsis sp. NPDC059021 TaxID=3346704 RepID=UPI00366B7811
MRLGGGLPLALAVGAASAGYWVLAAVVLAALLAGLAARLPRLDDEGPERYVACFARLAAVVVQATAFGVYVVPAYPGLAAAALIVVVVAADFAGIRLPVAVARGVTVVLLAAAFVLVAVCVVVAPVGTRPAIGSPEPSGVLVALLVVFPLLLPHRADHAGRRTAALAVVALLVTAAALYQLGAVRLGLSATSMRDLLAAADAGTLQPLLTVVLVLATLPASLATFTEARERIAPGRGTPALVAGLLAAAGAAVAGPFAALVAAGLGSVVELLLRVRASRYRGRRV